MEETMDEWQNCEVADCPFKSNWPLSKCHPHSRGLMIDQHRANVVTQEWVDQGIVGESIPDLLARIRANGDT